MINYAITADAVDKILEKLTEAAAAAQSTIGIALPHLVKAYIAFTIGQFVSSLIAIGLAWYMVRFSYMKGVLDNDGDPTRYFVMCIAGMVLGGIGTLIFLVTYSSVIAVFVDPLGALILHLIGAK